MVLTFLSVIYVKSLFNITKEMGDKTLIQFIGEEFREIKEEFNKGYTNKE